MGDIGIERREVEFEPLPVTVPAPAQPVRVPVTVPAPEPVRQPA